MASITMPIRLIVFLLFWSFGTTSVLYRSDVFPRPLTLKEREESSIPRACIAPCDLNSCGSGGSCSLPSSLKNRGFSLSGTEDGIPVSNVSDISDHPLAKRLFRFDVDANAPYAGDEEPTREEVKTYLPAVWNDGENHYFGEALQVVAADERAVSQQRQFGNEPFQIMAHGLHGCTAIVIVSNQGVWMTHLWESYSNGLDDEDTLGDEAFDQRVLKFLQGVTITDPIDTNYAEYVAPDGPAIDTTLFERSSSPQVYVVVPMQHEAKKKRIMTTSDAGDTTWTWLYKNRVEKEILPTLQNILGFRKKPVVYGYVRLWTQKPEEEIELETTHRGNVLFQYDPDSDGQSTRRWRLFIEDHYVRSYPL